MVTKINPVYVPGSAHSFTGKTFTELTVNIVPDVTGSTAPGGAIDSLIKVASNNATVVLMSAVTASGFTYVVEGDFPTDTYDGTNSQTFAAYMQAQFQALGTVDALNLAGTTVTAGTVYNAE